MDYTIYTKDSCPYCGMAKNALESLGFTYEERKIPDTATTEELQTRVTEAAEGVIVKTVPQIFHGDKYIGGATDLLKYLKTT